MVWCWTSKSHWLKKWWPGSLTSEKVMTQVTDLWKSDDPGHWPLKKWWPRSLTSEKVMTQVTDLWKSDEPGHWHLKKWWTRSLTSEKVMNQVTDICSKANTIYILWIHAFTREMPWDIAWYCPTFLCHGFVMNQINLVMIICYLSVYKDHIITSAQPLYVI